MPYIRNEGIGSLLVAYLPQKPTLYIIMVILFVGFYYVSVISMSLLLSLLVVIAYHANKRLGGATGDVYGASVELVEVGVLLGVVL